jgi:AP-3 complex subunit mu
VHVARGPLLLVGALCRDVPALLAIELLHRVGDLLELYLRELTEDALRANFVTVYQLLDEIIDNGAPLHTEPNVLQQLVMQPGKIDSIVASVTGASQVRNALPESTIAVAPWRRAGVRHTSNEIYLDLIERIDATVDGRNGVLQRAEVRGEATCKCLLSGMPRLTLSFTMPHIIEDAAFHACVGRERWERERVLSFTPPDGKFELFTYRVARTNSLPVYVTPVISFSETGGAEQSGSGAGDDGIGMSPAASQHANNLTPPTTDHHGGVTADADAGCRSDGQLGGAGSMTITVGARPTDGRPVEDVALSIPLPESVSNATLSATVGTAIFDTQRREVSWRIGKIPKDRLPILTGSLQFGAGRSIRDLSLSLFVSFTVANYSTSGLKVASLRVENEEYQPYKGVRSITQAGRFEVRC